MSGALRAVLGLSLIFPLLVVLAGCEEVEVPTRPETPPDFSILQVENVAPAEGTSLTAGSSGSYRTRIFYQRTDEDMARQGNLPIYFWVEVADLRGAGQRTWEGDLVFQSGAITDRTGVVELSGQFQLPSISPFCGQMDVARSITVAADEAAAGELQGTSPIPRSELSDKEDISQILFDVAEFPVQGVGTLVDPCVITMESWVEEGSFTFQWGEPVWIWGRRFPDQASPLVQFAGGEEIDFTINLGAGGEFDAVDSQYQDWGLVQTWVPSRAQTGPVRVFVDGQETDYGADARPSVRVDVEAGDYFEPNDDYRSPSTDPLDWGDFAFAINPGLTIDDVDQEVAAQGNPLGATDWGQGDWWRLEIPGAMDVCTAIFMDSTDDLDLSTFDASESLVGMDWEPGGSEVALTVVTTSGPTTLLTWVHPYSVATAVTRYELFAFDCAILDAAPAGTAVADGVPAGEIDPGLVAAIKGEGGPAGSSALPALRAPALDAAEVAAAVDEIRAAGAGLRRSIPDRPGPTLLPAPPPGEPDGAKREEARGTTGTKGGVR